MIQRKIKIKMVREKEMVKVVEIVKIMIKAKEILENEQLP